MEDAITWKVAATSVKLAMPPPMRRARPRPSGAAVAQSRTVRAYLIDDVGTGANSEEGVVGMDRSMRGERKEGSAETGLCQAPRDRYLKAGESPFTPPI